MNFALTNEIVGSIPQLHDLEVMPIHSLDSLRASNINLCSISYLLIPKDSRTCGIISSYNSIFVCNPKLPFLTLALIARITHVYL